MKAILIMDNMPNHCIECPICSLNEMTGLYNCMDGTKNEKCVDDYLTGNYGNKPKWCPLKPMPEKIGVSLKEAIGIKCSCYSDGYNDCIDLILGEND